MPRPTRVPRRLAAALSPGVAVALSATALAGPGPGGGDLPLAWSYAAPIGNAFSAGIRDMATSSSGVTYLVGISGSGGNTDAYTAAIGPDGSLLWADAYNGPSDWLDQARAVTLSPDESRVYVSGNTPSPTDVAQVLVLEYDAASGMLLDDFAWSSAVNVSESGNDIAVDAAGNVYVTGATSGDGSDAQLVSFDATRRLRWRRTYDGTASGPLSQDQGLKVRVRPDGSVVALYHGVNGTQPDYVVGAYDSDTGDDLWFTTWGTVAGEYPHDVEIDPGGDVLVTGTALFGGVDHYGTIRLDGADGALLWEAYDAFGIDDHVLGIALDADGDVHLTGQADVDGNGSNFNDLIYTVKRDGATGSLEWEHVHGETCIGCFDSPGDVVVDKAGNVFVAGTTSSPPYQGAMIVLVLDGASGVETTRGIVDDENPEPVGAGFARLDAEENLLVGGQTRDSTTGVISLSAAQFASLSGGPAAPGDVNGDGTVDFDDVLSVLAAWGPCAGCPADADGDGTVGFSDVLVVLSAWS